MYTFKKPSIQGQSVVVCFCVLLNALCWVSSPFTHADAGLKVGLVLDKGGKDDKSFNASAFRGLTQAKEKYEKTNALVTKVVESSDDTAYEGILRSFAQKDYGLIIAIGVAQAEAVKKVSAQFPNKKFAIVDAEVKAPNVRSLLFQEHEGSYLVGVAAAMASVTGKVGFVGGMDIPLIRRFLMGYEAGARSVNSKISVTANFVGVTGDAWNNPPKAKELAVAQYNAGVDVIYQAAGASGAGVFDAAEEKKKWAIGVDSNQNWVKPGRILTSMMKNVDHAVEQVIADTLQSKFSGGVVRYGLSDGGIGYAVDTYNEKILTLAMRKKLEEVKKNILSGKIKVPDYYQKK